MKRGDLGHIKAQAKAADELRERLDAAKAAVETFDTKAQGASRLRMEVSFYVANVYKGSTPCPTVPPELYCLLELILKERRDQLQKQFDELEIETQRKETE